MVNCFYIVSNNIRNISGHNAAFAHPAAVYETNALSTVVDVNTLSRTALGWARRLSPAWIWSMLAQGLATSLNTHSTRERESNIKHGHRVGSIVPTVLQKPQQRRSWLSPGAYSTNRHGAFTVYPQMYFMCNGCVCKRKAVRMRKGCGGKHSQRESMRRNVALTLNRGGWWAVMWEGGGSGGESS